MLCDRARPLLDAYLDGELDLAGSLEVERHLGECPACSRHLDNRAMLSSAIQAGGFRHSPPPSLERRIVGQLHREPGAPRRFPISAWAVPIAASLLIATAAGWAMYALGARGAQERLTAQQVISDHIRSLMADHLIDVRSTDRHTVKPWFDGKLDFSPQVKDFSAQGFSLVGGRLDYLNGRPAAALVYQRRAHFINLIVQPLASGSRAPSQAVYSSQGYAVIQWTSDGFGYWAVSDVNVVELREFARLFQAP